MDLIETIHLVGYVLTFCAGIFVGAIIMDAE